VLPLLLLSIFCRFGPVTEVRIVTDRETNMCKGYAFIGFAHKQIAMAALDGEGRLALGLHAYSAPGCDAVPCCWFELSGTCGWAMNRRRAARHPRVLLGCLAVLPSACKRVLHLVVLHITASFLAPSGLWQQ
jgi:hypothetical protein